jgi:hypothetical protein
VVELREEHEVLRASSCVDLGGELSYGRVGRDRCRYLGEGRRGAD